MAEIIPAVMPKSYEDLEEKMGEVVGMVPLIQVDVMDGVFVSGKTWPYNNSNDQHFAEILKEDKGFPFFEELEFEVDMMVSNPENHWESWLMAGAKRLIVHFESTKDPQGLIEEIRDRIPGSDSLLYTEIGVAINVDTPNEKIYPLIESVDFVQFMGIDKIGFQGNPFDEKVLAKIRDLRENFPDVVISVDGGVSLETAPQLIDAGANRLVAGSAIFESNDIVRTLEELESM